MTLKLPVDSVNPRNSNDLKEGHHHEGEVGREVVEEVHEVLAVLHPKGESQEERESAEKS